MSPAPGTTLEMAPGVAAAGGAWTPASLPGIVAWWDGSDAATITASGSPLRVSQWNDKSGNARHLTQGTGSKQPRSGTRTINGLNAVEFVAAGVEMMTASGIAQNPTRRHFIAVIAQDIDLGALHGGANPNTGAPECRMGDGFPCLLSTSVAHHHGSGNFRTGTMIYEVAVDTVAHTMKWYKDEAQFGITNTDSFVYTAASSGGQQIGSCDFAPSPWDGAIGEFIITDTIVTGADLTSLYNYLNAKWFSSLPASLPGLIAWWDAADTSSITASSGAVSQWNDKSGYGAHMVQATGANQPLTGVQTINGLNVIKFDGSNDGMRTAALSPQPAVQFYTLFVVGGFAVTTGSHGFGSGVGAHWPYGDATNSYVLFQPPGISNGNASAVNLGSAQPINQPVLYRLVVDSAGATARVQTTGQAAVSSGLSPWLAGPVSVNVSNWGVGDANSGRFINGFIAERLIYTRALSTTEVDSVENYLRAKWGIT